jgi:type I restriction enzyme S subunit
MAGFVTARLADVAEVKGGKRLPANANLVTAPTSHPYIRGRDIRDGKITFDDPMYVLDEDFEKIKRYTVDSGDVCITIVGNIGDVGITPPSLHRASLTENAVKLVNLREDIDARFLMYALLTPDAQSQMKLSAAGAAQPKLGIYKVNEIKVPLPSLPIQRRIAGILSTYDELIENSQRRIQILESMARAIYREWFIDFRFPGHESAPEARFNVDNLPSGWKIRKLEDVIGFHIGGGWGKEAPDEDHTEPAWVIRGTDIPDARKSRLSTVPYRFHTASNLRSRRLAAGDIVFEVSGGSKGQPVGRTLLVTPEFLSGIDGDVICASFCKRVQPDIDGYGSELLYLSFLEGYESGEIEQYQVQSTGISNFKWTEYIANTIRVVPPEDIRHEFRRLVAPLFTQISALGLKIENLRRTRDLLLPRLLSGQIDVEAIAA